MEALSTLFEVGKYALIGTVTGSLGIGILASGTETLQGTYSLFREEGEKPLWQKVRDLVLSLIEFIGITSVSLEWAQFLGWITLGVAAPFVAFIGYTAFALVNGAKAIKEFNALYRLLQEGDQPFFKLKVTAKVLHTLSKTCLVAVSVLGGIAFLTSCPPLNLASIIVLIVALLILGSAIVFDHQIAKRQRMQPLADAS